MERVQRKSLKNARGQKYYQKEGLMYLLVIWHSRGISELKGISIEASKIEKQSEKRLKKMNDIQEPWDNYKE